MQLIAIYILLLHYHTWHLAWQYSWTVEHFFITLPPHWVEKVLKFTWFWEVSNISHDLVDQMLGEVSTQVTTHSKIACIPPFGKVWTIDITCTIIMWCIEIFAVALLGYIDLLQFLSVLFTCSFPLIGDASCASDEMNCFHLNAWFSIILSLLEARKVWTHGYNFPYWCYKNSETRSTMLICDLSIPKCTLAMLLLVRVEPAINTCMWYECSFCMIRYSHISSKRNRNFCWMVVH